MKYDYQGYVIKTKPVPGNPDNTRFELYQKRRHIPRRIYVENVDKTESGGNPVAYFPVFVHNYAARTPL